MMHDLEGPPLLHKRQILVVSARHRKLGAAVIILCQPHTAVAASLQVPATQCKYKDIICAPDESIASDFYCWPAAGCCLLDCVWLHDMLMAARARATGGMSLLGVWFDSDALSLQ